MSNLLTDRRLLACATAFLLAAAAHGQGRAGPAPGSAAEQDKPNPNVGFDQKLGDTVPLDLTFTDEDGNETTLARCVDGKPTILVLAYYRCPMLCGEVFAGVLDACRHMPSSMTCGKEFSIVCVSFDPKEKPGLARAKKMHFVTEYGRKEADWGWHFLTGQKANIDKLTAACGFRYEYDPMLKEYNHPSGIMVVSPEGVISRYFPGIEYIDRGDNGQVVKDASRTLRLTLVEASAGKVGEPSDRFFLTCYQYNPHTGKYSASAMRIMQAGGILTLLIIAGVYARTSWKVPGVRVLVVCLAIYLVVLLPVIMWTQLPVKNLPTWAQRSVLVPVALVLVVAGRWAWKSAKRAQQRAATPPLVGAGVE
jgi:protein SCO1